MIRKIRLYAGVVLEKVKCLFSKSSVFATIVNSRVDSKAVLRKGVRFYGSSIGPYSYVTRNTLIQNTEIGSFCSISEDCLVGMPSHPVEMVSTSPVFLKGKNYLGKRFASHAHAATARTTIGSDVWIGARAMIKSGVTIGHGAVIGAGALVTKDVPPYAIVGGVPAKVIRHRFDQEMVEALLKLEWWNFSEEKLKELGKFMDDPQKLLDGVKQ